MTVWCETFAWTKCTGYLVYETCEGCDGSGHRYKWSYGDLDLGIETNRGITLCFKPEDIEDAGSCDPADIEIEVPVDPEDNRTLALSGVAGSVVVGVISASVSSLRPESAPLDPTAPLSSSVLLALVLSGILLVLLAMGLYRGTRRIARRHAGPVLIALSGLVLVSKGSYSLLFLGSAQFELVSSLAFYAMAGVVAPLSFWRLFSGSRTWGALSGPSLLVGLATGGLLAASYLAPSPFREAAGILAVAITLAWVLGVSLRLLYVPVPRKSAGPRMRLP